MKEHLVLFYNKGSTGISMTLLANSLGKKCHIYLPDDLA